MLATSSAWAGQVDLSLESRLGGDSNVFRSEKPKKEDGTWELMPRLGVREENDDLNYAFDYQANYRNYINTVGIDGVDHTGNGRVSWAVTPIDKIEASGSYYNGRQFLFGRNVSSPVPSFDVNDRERIRISDATLSYNRMLSRALSLRLSGTFDDFDASGTSEQSQTDSRAYTGQLATEYALGPLTEVGLTLSSRRRENRATGPFRPSSRTDVWDLMFSVSRRVTPTFVVSAQAGPSFIRQQQVPAGAVIRSTTCLAPTDAGCQDYPNKESSAVTLFATASARQSWKTTDLSASYIRSEARSGNTASSSSIADRVQLNLDHRVSDRLTLRALAAWDRLDQIFSQAGGTGRFTQYLTRTTETVEFALSRRWYLIGQYTFMHQVNDASGQTRVFVGDPTAFKNKVQVHIGFVGVRFTFEPLEY